MRLRIGFGGTIEAAVLVSASAMMGTDLAPRNDIVISEVSYNPPAALGADDEYEFVELANRGSNAVDVSGWQLKDRDDFHSYYLPAGTEIPSGGFLVIARDCAALRQAYGAEVPCVGGVAFPLGNDGDTVRILDGAGRLVDQVTYLDERPWPFEADGVDATLERISLAEDITDFSNFASSEPNATAPGTPGRVNSRAGSLPARHQVVINEIQYNPVRAPAVDPLRHCPGEEFVELHNRGAAAADVSGWRFEEGISYTIPAGTQISAGGYLVIYPDRAAFESKYGILDNAIGPYGGQLDDGGERLLLADAASNVVDSVEYNDAYPWPVNPDGLSGSLELMDPTSDNDRGQAWRESVDFRGTPGERNSAAAALDSGGGNAGPQITQVAAMANGERDRRELRSTDAARIEARILDRQGVASATVEYQTLPAGSYVRRTDPAYETDWTSVPLSYEPETMLYAAVLPPVPHRTLVRYRIRAVDRGAQPAASVAPGPLDPEPNFAYFVYDGVPDYVAQHRSAFGPAGHVHTELDRVPVYHIVANGADVEEAQYTQYSEGGNHRWRVSLVHNGHVHDHVLLELRSGHRYSWPKRPWKIHMNRGNLFDGRTNDGTPYPRKRRKLHFMSAQHDPGKPRGESGVFESLAWRLFREAGVIGASTTFVQLRFVRSPEEHDQFLGDFFGIFLETQRIDSTALEDNGRPADSSAALYKMAGGPVKKHPDCTASLSDAQQFLADTNSVQTREWYEANLNLPTYLSFRVVVELTDDHDMDSLKNFFYYRPSPSQPWEVIPWDLDNTFGAESSGDEPLRNRVLPLFPVEYRNRFRFLWQVLYDEKRLFHGIDAWGDQIRGLADADLDRWDTEPREACPSWPQTTGANCKEYAPFLSRMRGLKIWIRNQTKITASAMRDALAPQTPANASPRPGWPAAAAVRLQTSAFAGPGEGGGHAATRWMVIERGGDWAFPAWTVDAPGAALETTVPADVTIPGHEYLFRAAHQNASGRWSLLSEPTAFVAGRGDSTPPQPPSGLTAAWVSARGVELRWNTSADLESGVFGYVVRRDGEPLRPAPVREARIHDFRPSSPATHRYDVVAVNGAGLESSPSSPLDVVLPELTELGGWRLPDGGWDYIYDARDGEAAFTSGAAGLDGGNLDGTWARSRVDDWDGSPPGEPDGAPGGARLAVSEPEHAGEEPASVLSIEDAGSDAAPTLPPPANQRIYFLRPAGDGSLLEGGVTLLARWRVNPAPLDLPASKGQSPEAGSARGHFGLSQRGPGGDRTFALWLDEGRLFASGGVQLAVETTRFQAVWATIEPEGAAMRVRVYLNGNSSPSADEIVDLSASELESALGGNYLQMGLAHRADSGAIEIDFAGYKAGVHSPRPLAGGPQRFVRGDVDADGKAGLEDALDVLHYLFTAGPAFACIDAADADDSGSTEVTDAIYILRYALLRGAAPPPPFPACGEDATEDGLPRCSAEGCRA